MMTSSSPSISVLQVAVHVQAGRKLRPQGPGIWVTAEVPPRDLHHLGPVSDHQQHQVSETRSGVRVWVPTRIKQGSGSINKTVF